MELALYCSVTKYHCNAYRLPKEVLPAWEGLSYKKCAGKWVRSIITCQPRSCGPEVLGNHLPWWLCGYGP